jgi:hypothetical protein
VRHRILRYRAAMPHTQSVPWLECQAQYLQAVTYRRDGRHRMFLLEHDGSMEKILKPWHIADLYIASDEHPEEFNNRDLLWHMGSSLYDLAETQVPLPMDRK